ncbi:hypothetical protein N7517_004589 [Penicillium concentricum]|uniref:Uncharacterized protein n=1 Tax=Penicillium concentricum TaxID=293559 RepID=A0A9W9SAI0_9EURO|nr:uncharacterized protein N7517_004589 [Penicillium concentricum]KAJ5372583.1 hypothetical protein N7517_004589 [Penicillium concentricum]
MSSLNITLRSHSAKCRFPERAMAYITIESTGESENTVSYGVNVTASLLRHFLESLCPSEEPETTQAEAAVSSFSSSPILIVSKNPNTADARENRHGRPRIYNAVITTFAIFCDFNELQKFIVKVDEYSNAKLNNAVLDAVMKANQYAKAAGFERATPVDIKEIEPQTMNAAGYPQRPIYRHSSGVSLTPQDIVLNCCVEVAFECVGDLGSGDT